MTDNENQGATVDRIIEREHNSTANNEKLIEEAAKAIYENERRTIDPGWPAWEDCRDGSKESVLDAARDALAVFEKAHTPTDDEREALIAEAARWPAPDGLKHAAPPGDLILRLASALRLTDGAHQRADWDRVHNRPADIYTPPEDRVASPSRGEPSDAGVGWFEWFKMPENTTEIAYVHENGEVFDPVRGWNPVEFTIAAAEGRVHRLVRAGGVR